MCLMKLHSRYCVASEFDVKKLELNAQLELKKLESVEREKECERESIPVDNFT